MFIGHFAVGLAVRRKAPNTSLGTLFLAGTWCDILFSALLLSGVEHAQLVPGDPRMVPVNLGPYPWSHSLLMTAVWAVVLSGSYTLLRKDRHGGFWIGVCVLSHWVLDLISHRPDMPLYPGGLWLGGWGLWNSRLATAVVEGGFFIWALSIYLRGTRMADVKRCWGIPALGVFLLLMFSAGLLAPPPPSITALAVVNQAVWLFIVWGWWGDRQRLLSV